jgi:hypothetical protein
VRTRLIPAVILAWCALSGSVALADVIAFQDGALLPGGGTYASTQDTEIHEGEPTLAFGSDPGIRADTDLPPLESQILLRFDDIFGAGPGQIALGSTIVSAVLQLECFNSSNVPIGNISVYQLTASFSESSTWDSLTDGVEVGTDTVASPDDVHTVESIAPTSFDVTASLQAWASGASNEGWVILNDNTDGVVFRSSEYGTQAQRPLLTVTFTPVPEPGSLLLAGLAGAAALCVRRFRAR